MRTDGLGLRGPDERGDGLWGALCAAETGLRDAHLDDLLQTFTGEVRHSGGADLDPAELGWQMLLYAAVMGITWLLDVPARLRARLGPDTASVTRFDPRIADDESMRAPLQMLSNVLNLWPVTRSARCSTRSVRVDRVEIGQRTRQISAPHRQAGRTAVSTSR